MPSCAIEFLQNTDETKRLKMQAPRVLLVTVLTILIYTETGRADVIERFAHDHFSSFQYKRKFISEVVKIPTNHNTAATKYRIKPMQRNHSLPPTMSIRSWKSFQNVWINDTQMEVSIIRNTKSVCFNCQRSIHTKRKKTIIKSMLLNLPNSKQNGHQMIAINKMKALKAKPAVWVLPKFAIFLSFLCVYWIWVNKRIPVWYLYQWKNDFFFFLYGTFFIWCSQICMGLKMKQKKWFMAFFAHI